MLECCSVLRASWKVTQDKLRSAISIYCWKYAGLFVICTTVQLITHHIEHLEYSSFVLAYCFLRADGISSSVAHLRILSRRIVRWVASPVIALVNLHPSFFYYSLAGVVVTEICAAITKGKYNREPIFLKNLWECHLGFRICCNTKILNVHFLCLYFKMEFMILFCTFVTSG